MSFTFIDLFGGIGGFHEACNSFNAECVLTSEVDANARKTYERNHITGVMDTDITALKPADVPDHDVLFAGFPCQPFSQAGFKHGFADQRGTMFYYVYKILEEKRPPVAFLENVRALVKHDNGHTMSVILTALRSLGYAVSYKVVFAKDHGLPQLRPRVFIICSLVGEYVWPEPVPLDVTLDAILGGTCTRSMGFTVRCGGRGSPIHGRHNWDGYVVDGEPIRLTVRQAARLQGFPHDFCFPVSDTAAFKQLGNAVAVPVVRRHITPLVHLLRSVK